MPSRLDPLPSERLRVGQCTVDVPLREIHAPGARRPVRVTPKSMGVLLMLVDNADKVVSRDALLAGVWPDTLPTNDVVTQAVTQLRKAFGEARDNPQYIETIAKGGYRLLADVEWLPASDPEDRPPTVQEAGRIDAAPADGGSMPLMAGSPGTPVSRQRVGWVAIIGAMAVMALLVALVIWWSLARDEAPRSRIADAAANGTPAYGLESRLITSSPGFELAPSLSPDASMVAYVAVPQGQRNIAIMVQATTPTTPRQLTRPSGQADDFSPAWSPDGREIAFLRLVPGERCEVRIVSASGGAERVVGRCDHHHLPSFDWAPDGNGLIFGSHGVYHDRPGLHLLDLATGQLRALEYQASFENHDFWPRYSPDGRWIVFVRNTPVGDFWRLPATGGTAERLTHLNAQVLGWDWSPSGRALIYSHYHDNASRLYRFDLASGARVELGLKDGEEPSTAADVPALAYVQRSPRFGIYRFDLGEISLGTRLFTSSGRDRLPAIAPDGRQLVFISDRSGEYRLWWVDVEQPGSLRLLEGLQPESRHLPHWSADSQRLLVVGRDTGVRGGGGTSGVYEVVPASGRISRLSLPLEEPVQATYMPGPGGVGERLLVVAADERGRLRLDLLDRRDDGWKRAGTLQDVSRVEVDAVRGRVLFARPGQPGLWQADLRLDPGSVRQVDSAWPTPSRYRSWTAATEGGIYGIERTADCAARLEVHGGQAETPPRCLDRNRRAASYGLSLDPRSNRLYVTLVEYDIGDIGFATYDPPPESFWPGVNK